LVSLRPAPSRRRAHVVWEKPMTSAARRRASAGADPGERGRGGFRLYFTGENRWAAPRSRETEPGTDCGCQRMRLPRPSRDLLVRSCLSGAADAATAAALA